MADTRTLPASRKGEDGASPVAETAPRALAVASGGIRTAEAGGRFCEAMILDSLEDRIPYQRANVALRAYGQLLRTVDMNQRYGQDGPDGRKSLRLLPSANDASGEVVNETPERARKR